MSDVVETRIRWNCLKRIHMRFVNKKSQNSYRALEKYCFPAKYIYYMEEMRTHGQDYVSNQYAFINSGMIRFLIAETDSVHVIRMYPMGSQVIHRHIRPTIDSGLSVAEPELDHGPVWSQQ